MEIIGGSKKERTLAFAFRVLVFSVFCFCFRLALSFFLEGKKNRKKELFLISSKS